MKVIRFLHCVVHFNLHFSSRSVSFNVTCLKRGIICLGSTRELSINYSIPALNSNGSPEANRQTYLAFLQNVNSFREAEGLPVELKFGDDVDVDCLGRNHSSWHKSCHLKFSLSQLKKAQERVGRKRSDDSKRDLMEEGPAREGRNRRATAMFILFSQFRRRRRRQTSLFFGAGN